MAATASRADGRAGEQRHPGSACWAGRVSWAEQAEPARPSSCFFFLFLFYFPSPLFEFNFDF